MTAKILGGFISEVVNDGVNLFFGITWAGVSLGLVKENTTTFKEKKLPRMGTDLNLKQLDINKALVSKSAANGHSPKLSLNNLQLSSAIEIFQEYE